MKDGSFRLERLQEQTYLRVVNDAQTLGAVSEIEADESGVVLRLKKLGSASGRLMTEDGSQAAASVKLAYGIRIYDKDGPLSTTRFGKVLTTDTNGEFQLPRLVPGWEYECRLYEQSNGFDLNVTNIKIEAGQRLGLGELRMPKIPNP